MARTHAFLAIHWIEARKGGCLQVQVELFWLAFEFLLHLCTQAREAHRASARFNLSGPIVSHPESPLELGVPSDESSSMELTFQSSSMGMALDESA